MVVRWFFYLLLTLAAVLERQAQAFAPQWSVSATRRASGPALRLAGPREEDEDDEAPENPYADPNYPDLEFVNYSDPEYQVDMGVGDEFYSEKSTEEQIEEMREERRKKNDEFQFQTYYTEILKKGDAEFRGEWTVYQTSTFLDDIPDGPTGMPRLVEATTFPLTVISKGRKESDVGDYNIDTEKLFHSETVAEQSIMGDLDIEAFQSNESSDVQVDKDALVKEIVETFYCPKELKASDFRGEQGNMVCGNAWTLCSAVAPGGDQSSITGPFSEYRTEVGVQTDAMRFRIKLDYRTAVNDKLAPLCLKTLTVCRETLNDWPRTANANLDDLFGAPGSPGGLYDPPPVGSEEQAAKYMLVDLDGGATILFPYEIDQKDETLGWVTSLDWSAAGMRYQVDRKIQGGPNVMGLRTLELSEVQAANAEQYRPRDGGQNMRQ